MTRIPVKTVPVDDVTLAYGESGSGYPVVLISGLGSTMDMWNPPVLEKISHHFRVIIFDNRNTGYSSASDKPLSIPLLARDTAMLMDALGISSAHILGHSMGASIAQELALSFPAKVTRLILVAGPVHVEPDPSYRPVPAAGRHHLRIGDLHEQRPVRRSPAL